MNLRFLYNMAVVHEFVKEIQSFFAIFKERRDGDGEFIAVIRPVYMQMVSANAFSVGISVRLVQIKAGQNNCFPSDVSHADFIHIYGTFKNRQGEKFASVFRLEIQALFSAASGELDGEFLSGIEFFHIEEDIGFFLRQFNAHEGTFRGERA